MTRRAGEGRWQHTLDCPRCFHLNGVHQTYWPSETTGVCEICGAPLVLRAAGQSASPDFEALAAEPVPGLIQFTKEPLPC